MNSYDLKATFAYDNLFIKSQDLSFVVLFLLCGVRTKAWLARI